MKRKVSDIQLLVADLDKNEDEDIEVLTSSMSLAISGFDEVDQFKRFPFQNKDLFGVIAEKLVEFRRGNEIRDVGNLQEKWGEDFLKKNFNFFNYLMFHLDYDKANNSLSRIALLRKHIVELKMVCEGIDIEDCIANELVCYEFCK